MHNRQIRILCAPDSFKLTLPADQAAVAMANGLRRGSASVQADQCPVADGGEGTLDVLAAALDASRRTARVTGPLGKTIEASYAVCRDGVGLIELAQACGLGFVPSEERNPLQTTSHGAGQLVACAMLHGCHEIIIGLGGSATVDGGAGLCQALGVEFTDARGRLARTPLCGGRLGALRHVTRGPLSIQLRAACDVANPLLGVNGAATVYGPQKGATPQQVDQLEAGLAHFAAMCGGNPEQPGAGAAGGAGYGLATLLGATLERGIDLVLDAVRFDERCRASRLVITGEGRLDSQSAEGKAAVGVARRAARLGVPTIAIVGDVGPDDQPQHRAVHGCFQRVLSLTERFGRERAMAEPAVLIEQVCMELGREFADNRES